VVVGPRPCFGLCGGLVFWFGLFLCLRWDGRRNFCPVLVCCGYVGWGGVRMGGHVGGCWTVSGSSCFEYGFYMWLAANSLFV
jgi:hypothetical protein